MSNFETGEYQHYKGGKYLVLGVVDGKSVPRFRKIDEE